MLIPRLAYEAINEAIENSTSAEFTSLSEDVGMPQPPEARQIMQRMHTLVAGARVAKNDDAWVDLPIAYFNDDDVSCLLGIITGLWMTYGIINQSMNEAGEFDRALEAAGMVRSLAQAGGLILKSRYIQSN